MENTINDLIKEYLRENLTIDIIKQRNWDYHMEDNSKPIYDIKVSLYVDNMEISSKTIEIEQ